MVASFTSPIFTMSAKDSFRSEARRIQGPRSAFLTSCSVPVASSTSFPSKAYQSVRRHTRRPPASLRGVKGTQVA